jgi:hypothetical protein
MTTKVTTLVKGDLNKIKNIGKGQRTTNKDKTDKIVCALPLNKGKTESLSLIMTK